MRVARSRALVLIAAVLVGAAAVAFAVSNRSGRPLPPRPGAERPKLLLLTSLPLVFGEQFSLEGGGSPALKALEGRYRVVPISVTDEKDLAKGRLLLMAHPLAQPAEDLVALDAWVRSGGRVLLLADPALEWPSERPLGDPLRPPPMFMDTGLLGHWGLRLDAPDERGPVRLGGGHKPVIYVSPGRIVSTNAACELSRADIIAECLIGKGKATVVADADFVNTDVVERYGGVRENQMDELLELLAALERR
jgi:hypothetical protein